jgi:hypothetical protein
LPCRDVDGDCLPDVWYRRTVVNYDCRDQQNRQYDCHSILYSFGGYCI